MVTGLCVSAAVFSEEKEGGSLVGLELDEAVPEEHRQDEEDDAEDHPERLDIIVNACGNHIYREEDGHSQSHEEHNETVSP